MPDDQRRTDMAQRILFDREVRYDFFPCDIFDEYAWKMLLRLFVAKASGKVMGEKELINLVHVNVNIGQRWLYLLAKDGQVESRLAGEDVVLTEKALTKLRGYLDTVELDH
jgi:hypothetical protein